MLAKSSSKPHRAAEMPPTGFLAGQAAAAEAGACILPMDGDLVVTAALNRRADGGWLATHLTLPAVVGAGILIALTLTAITAARLRTRQ